VRYSGYPGGQKTENYAMLTARKGTREVIRKAVLGMLPKNRLQHCAYRCSQFKINVWLLKQKKKGT